MLFLLIFIWSLLAHFNDPIILPGPKIVINTLFELLKTKDTYLTIADSLNRVVIGLVIAFLTGIPVGLLASSSKGLRDLIIPVIRFMQSTPVISWILLALIWFKLWTIPIFILFLNSFPILVINVYEGILGIDKKLLEMSGFYNVKKMQRIEKLYIPSIISHILASTTIILSSSFKIVVMSEIITKINTGIGSNINSAWINIETEKILAWTIIVVILGLGVEKTVNNLLKKKLGRYYA